MAPDEISITCFIFTTLCTLAACADEVQIIDETQSWAEARESCRKQSILGSCDLITKQRLHETWTDMEVSGSDSFWVGGQRLFQWVWQSGNQKPIPLFEDHGCYELTGEKDGLKALQTNGPFQCYQHCHDLRYTFLQGDTCYCARTLEGQAAPGDQCPLRCDGSQDMCGGEQDVFSVYSLPATIRFVDDAASENCAVGRLQEDVLRVESTSCRGYHHYFCLSDNQSSVEIIPSRSEQFDTAVSRCQTRHDSTLLSLSSILTPSLSSSPRARGEEDKRERGARELVTDLKNLFSKMSGPLPVSFWLPLQRRVKTVWVDGEAGEQGGEFGFCLAATARTASYRLTDLPCTEYQPAICDCHGQPTINGTKEIDPEEANELSKTALVITAAAFIVFGLIFVALILFIFIRRRSAIREEERQARQKWGQNMNPLFRGSPEADK